MKKFLQLAIILTSLLLSGCSVIVEKEPEETQKSIVETIPTETEQSSIEDSLTGLETESEGLTDLVLPDASNGYVVQKTMGEDTVMDLDGDGTEDTIHYELGQYVDTGNNYDYVRSFSINQTEYAKEPADEYSYMNTLEDYQIGMETPYTEFYFIVDLDTSDSYKEIAICDWGFSDDLTTYFLRYDAGTLTNLGYIPGFPTSDHFKLDGAGTVQAEGELNIFMTWYTIYTWKTEADGKLVQEKPDMYQPSEASYEYNKEFPVNQLVTLTLYESPDQNAATFQVDASDAVVTFTETDNEHWVHMTRTDGVDGWIYIQDNCYIISGQEQIFSMDAFVNLYMVG